MSREGDAFDDPTYAPNPLRVANQARDRQQEMESRYIDYPAVVDLIGMQAGSATYMAKLRDAIGVTGLAAELVKKDRTTKSIHEQLNALGIPDKTTQGVGICLEGRLALVFSKLQQGG